MNAEEYKNSLLGYKVGIKWKDGEQQIYEIVNENEKDIMNKKISINTEFAKSLNNKKVGDVVEFISNNIKNCYTIIALENIKLSDCITARNLTKLYHYTSLENIKSIFTYGLLNVNTLKENNIDFLGNDKLRLDKKNDCISCSLEYPNNKLLWTNIYNYSRRYCLLEIDINILKERKSFCCYTNAARFSGDLIMPIGNIDELFSGERKLGMAFLT